jgi:hypothetical protein
MKKLRVDMRGLLDGLQTSDHDPMRYYFDLETGEVIDILVPDYDDTFEDGDRQRIETQPDRFKRVPNVPGRRQYRWMEEFVDGLDEADVGDKLRIALAGRGAFGRFREVLHQWPDLQERWYSTRQQLLVDEGVEWLSTLEIDPQYDIPGPDSPPPQSSRGRATRISLVHVLLLAAPEGTPELVDGKVRRLVKAEDAGSARTLFKALAREWCEMRGVGWRKRFVENRDDFELEGLTLRVVASSVEVVVVVPAETARVLGGS